MKVEHLTSLLDAQARTASVARQDNVKQIKEARDARDAVAEECLNLQRELAQCRASLSRAQLDTQTKLAESEAKARALEQEFAVSCLLCRVTPALCQGTTFSRCCRALERSLPKPCPS
jgi:hypothetical protein